MQLGLPEILSVSIENTSNEDEANIPMANQLSAENQNKFLNTTNVKEKKITRNNLKKRKRKEKRRERNLVIKKETLFFSTI